MRKIIFVCAVIFLACQALKLVNAIPWRSDYEAATREAVTKGKPLMVYFQVKWCGQCRKLEGGALGDWTVKEHAREFICVKLDAEARADLAFRFGVQGYPTILFLDPYGKVLNRFEGYGMGAKALLRLKMKNALNRKAGRAELPEVLFIQDLFF
ncbi:MAG TPA: thioredoxin family protein [Candidatus Omnitrophota bacterium]|nr:thioredoxin family protein [Candidatus Omnitrophota bacterium]HPS36670.1 thioredoxin family protein [Candidatus Omnitrophota bacterium]